MTTLVLTILGSISWLLTGGGGQPSAPAPAVAGQRPLARLSSDAALADLTEQGLPASWSEEEDPFDGDAPEAGLPASTLAVFRPSGLRAADRPAAHDRSLSPDRSHPLRC